MLNTSKYWKVCRAASLLAATAVIVAFSLGTAAAQSRAQAVGVAVPTPEGPSYSVTFPQMAVGFGSEGAQVPQDIRIMQRIVSTALAEVEAPQLPATLQEEGEPQDTGRTWSYSVGGEAALWALAGSGGRTFSISGRDVTGFYMQGYGYLFTINWQVSPRGRLLSIGLSGDRTAELNALVVEARRAAAAAETTAARAAGEAERTLEQERQMLEERQEAWDAWSAEYRDVLANALREVVANYGSTLKRATPEESITFIADFGGGDAETVTVSARRGDLSGADRAANLGAVRMAKGETGVSDILRTELKIMAEIIDSSLQGGRSGDGWIAYTEEVRYFGGDSSYQYVPGYGVLFRKGARLNLATQAVHELTAVPSGADVTVQSLRQRMEATSEEQREAYADHLADLKQTTAMVLATYGPTLTELSDDEWVGIYYNVGSAAGLLEGGISNFLVQARMGDVRQAADETDGAAWLLERLVSNEKRD